MPKVIVQQVELDLTLDQVVAIVRQLKPEEREVIRQAIEPPPWDQRLEALLTRVWARVDRDPITEEEIDAEVERARTTIYSQGSR
ncbi:MAG: hypothetical protein M5U01_40475 [Ardenticatenaceae bacterium]|nr:hypothetical protein [Ardenticatenaceae bacterium]